ncbi:uncharacterized protein EDB93DRAFT_1131789 [Suillus bovinus]|uniref:uncharacterized protein n=1 Tax=Suillus bovinus TaxID=48563 RepID=UPI001B88373E|nr:uncharacterized protein EDB93DRAFT_1131789 [Suillus bovinus]KAG2154364.1 hypothetical protein EDB93DRAFT_1131789 [Suillus bovinus]
MTNGPPPSQAGPSQPSETSAQQPAHIVPVPASSTTSQQTITAGPSSQLQPVQYGPATQGQNPQGYYAMSYTPGGWQNAWQVPSYPYIASGSVSGQQTHYTQVPYPQYQPPAVTYQPRQRTKVVQKPRSPTPEPELHRHWDEVIRSFLKKVGMNQALKGFEDDMVVMNAEWERQKVPGAIGDLMKDLMNLGKPKGSETLSERPLEERKLDYVHLSGSAKPQSQTSITRSISQFLAQNRARNDASNRTEFLESLAQKRRRLNLDPDSTEPIPSCARTDAKHLDRDVQMKYDIAKNEDGPLRRTMKGVAGDKGSQKELLALNDDAEGEQQPATDQRVKNIEEHLAVRYVPAPPRTLMSRLRLLEDHLLQLEKDYPPWAALHFNQPNRGWPPPPRHTPIIVPSHITTTRESKTDASQQELSSSSPTEDTPHTKVKNKSKSSLHRAVMEKLEIQKAMSDLAGVRKSN